MFAPLRSATYLAGAASLLTACVLTACNGAMQSTAAEQPLPPVLGQPPAGGAAVATPGATGAVATTPMVAQQTPPPGQNTGTGMQPVATPQVQPPMTGNGGMLPPEVPMVAAKVTDRGSCAAPDRRVSYHNPCNDDPDPCKLGTSFDGDNYCWPAPAAGQGVQMHIGPADWNDPKEVQKYVVEPGTETLDWWAGVNPMTENHFFDHVQVRMRPGSHHWMIGLVGGKLNGGRYGQQMNCGSNSVGGLGGGQSLILDSPPQGIPAPEDVGYGAELQGNSTLCANIHHYNLTDHPQVREMWMNVYYTDEAKVTKRGERITMIGATGLAIPPGQQQTLTYQAVFGAEGRIRSLFGHRHMYTDRFAVWVNQDLIYDSWDWMESVTFLYDSITANPPLNTEGKKDGAKSGIVPIKAGDVLKYSCFVNNKSDVTLTFRNDVDTGEMCNLFGGTVGTGTGVVSMGF